MHMMSHSSMTSVYFVFTCVYFSLEELWHKGILLKIKISFIMATVPFLHNCVKIEI